MGCVVVGIPDFASKYVGMPFKQHGRDMSGADCYGLHWIIGTVEYGQTLPKYDVEYADAHDRNEVGTLIRHEMSACWEECEAENGSLILLRVMGQPWHVGTVIAPGIFIHIIEGSNACIERYDSKNWNRRLLGFYRYVL